MRVDPPAAHPDYSADDPFYVGPLEEAPPPPKKRSRWKTLKRVFLICLALFIAIIGWLAFTAPLSQSLQPLAAPSLTILSADGEPIARRGAMIGEPVSAAELPDHVTGAFLAIEDRRFRGHLGIDPLGILRAMVRNAQAGEVREGGSTITQQLAKTSFLSSDRTAGRKIQEALIALWLEAWLTKDEILSRYLSNVYFGDNVYGLRAAARHYFNRDPEDLTVPQAAMLAGLVNAPSRLAPTRHLSRAQERSRLVMRAMVEAGMLTEREHDRLRPARLNQAPADDVPTGTYFADWVLRQAQFEEEGEGYGQRTIRTTLDGRLQRLAVRAVRNAGLGNAQVALVAMRPDGRVVAMIGGRSYRQSPFNRATQARRQPGSTFKLFVYLAALREGWRPDSMIEDSPLTLGEWAPSNYEDRYSGRITLEEALRVSSNVGTVRLQEEVGRQDVIRAARDLGITSPLTPHPSLALGTSGVSLIEMTAAYAAVASGGYPVRPHGLPREEEEGGWFSRLWSSSSGNTSREPAMEMMRDMLFTAANRGTGRAAALRAPTFGKTGTTQDNRDALFIGFAEDLVVGVWIGRDDNRPLPGMTGGGLPAQIWRSFMSDALGTSAAPPPPPVPLSETDKQIVPPEEGTQPVDEPVGVPLPFEDSVGPFDGADPVPVEPDLPAPKPDREPIEVPVDRAPPPPRSEPTRQDGDVDQAPGGFLG